MAAVNERLRISLQPDTPAEHTELKIALGEDSPAEHTRLTIDVNAEELRIAANPTSARINYYSFDGSALLNTETVASGGSGTWDGAPERPMTDESEYVFAGWALAPNQAAADLNALASVYGTRKVYAAYQAIDISAMLLFDNVATLAEKDARATWNGTIEYSIDGLTWTQWDGTEIAAGPEKRIRLRGTGNRIITGLGGNGFAMTAAFACGVSCYGNTEALLDYATVAGGGHPTMNSYSFTKLFENCTDLRRAPDLGSVTLTSMCYYAMFKGCSKLDDVQALPAFNAQDYCYAFMFSGCSALKSTPEIGLTVAASHCCTQMFAYCTSLESGPAALTAWPADQCFSEMFLDCSALTAAPTLGSTITARYCYYRMFEGCTALKMPPRIGADSITECCCMRMFERCTALRELPELKALNIGTSCYSGMFKGCASIKLSETQGGDYSIPFRIPSTGTGTLQSSAMFDMFANTGGTFAGTPMINTTYYLAAPAA